MRELFEKMNQTIVPSVQLKQRTRERMRQERSSIWIPRLQRAAISVLCVLLLFIGVVNGSPAFASTVAKVPIVKELVLAVSFDPSMKAAIEHAYVQLVKKQVRDNGIQLDVEYLIADQANVTVYYALQGVPSDSSAYRTIVELTDAEGVPLEGYSSSWGEEMDSISTLSCAQFHFKEGVLPEQIHFVLYVEMQTEESSEKKAVTKEVQIGSDAFRERWGEVSDKYTSVATLTVPLTIDANSLYNVRTVSLQQPITIEGQKILLKKAVFYPTQVRIFWEEAENNAAWIAGLQMKLLGDRKHQWSVISNGVSGVGTIGEEQQTWLDSSWFSEDTSYRLQIDKVQILPKKNQKITYDYSTKSVEGLPSYITLKEAVPTADGLYLNFQIETEDTMTNFVFDSEYLDGTGQQQWMSEQGATSYFAEGSEENKKYRKEKKGENARRSGFHNMFVVKNYTQGPIVLTLLHTPWQSLDGAIVVPLKDSEESF